jgi:hypothetical protein
MTGYVHHMIEKNQTFPQFAMSCARAFGALIEMRDEGIDAKIPDEIKPEPYHKKAAAEARKELAAFEAMTKDGRLAWVEATKRREVDAYRQCIKDAKASRAQLAAMVAQIEEWEPPTGEHVRLKEFMLQQVRDSMPSTDYYDDQIAIVQAKDAEELVAERFATLQHNIAYHDQHYAEEVERAKQRTDWVKRLRASL